MTIFLKNQCIRLLKNYAIKLIFCIFILLVFFESKTFSQKKTVLGFTVEPNISWFSNDNQTIDVKGVNQGINFGFELDRFFAEKYAISTGLFITGTGGNLAYSDSVFVVTATDTVMIPEGTKLTYNLNQLKIPIGLKLRTVQIGYSTYFIDFGLNALFRLNSKASGGSILDKDAIKDEIQFFNLAYFIGGGMEYTLGGNTSILIAIYYTSTFLDATTDILNKPKDYLRIHQLALKAGIIF